MKKASTDGANVHMIETLSISELTIFCDVNAEWVVTLVEHGVVAPITQTAREWEFTPPHIARARKASRLMRDLGLNFAGVALVLDLIEERDALLRKLTVLETSKYA
ncbi:MAG: chaperone modulatory protein CbpM [Yoonia sp.]|jgi:chaperone modulatory protein CbpM